MAHLSISSAPAAAGIRSMVLPTMALLLAAVLAGCAHKGFRGNEGSSTDASSAVGHPEDGTAKTVGMTTGSGTGSPASGGRASGSGARSNAGGAGNASLQGDTRAGSGEQSSGTSSGDGTQATGGGGQDVAQASGSDGQTYTAATSDSSEMSGGSTAGGATGAGSGGDTMTGSSEAARGTTGDAAGGRSAQTAQGQGVGGGSSEDATVVGMVDAPGDRARVDEEVTPQTLGGMLPLVVGIDEEGHFDFDRAVLRPEVRTALDGLADKLKDAQYDRLDIIGFTDRIGTDEYNQQLSERRAWAVARYLMGKGIPLSKLRVEGRGERESVLAAGECATVRGADLVACLQNDRRVQIEASIRKSHVKVN